LAGSEWVTANPELITKIILKGLKGEISVKGKKYGTTATVVMLAVDIDDADIANVATYVRNAWGNSATEIFEKDVADVRKNTLEQESQWIGQDLQLEYLSDFGSD
jgi:mono/diheme cytochrome c family protein